MLLSGIDAIVFDAVGTVIHPEPPAAVVYVEVGRRYGSRLTVSEATRRFAAAFAEEEERDRAAGFRTSEARERERWRRIVEAVLDDVSDREACFLALFEHFGRPQAWRCEPDAASTFQGLAARSFTAALASNYDARLRPVAAGLPELLPLHHLVISSEVGWRKPAPEFFAALCRSVDRPASGILYVGDDRCNDYEGARAAGMQALLFDPREKRPSLENRLARLSDLLKLLPISNTMSSITLFVYGTLKRGCSHHALLARQRFIGTARTLSRYRLYDSGPFPCLVEALEEGNAVWGELWRVDSALLPALDEYEEASGLFERRELELEDFQGPVYAYFYNGTVSGFTDCGAAWEKKTGTPPPNRGG